MEIIYSRNGFRFPKGKKIAKKKVAVFLILAILFYIICFIVKGIYPIFYRICQNEAHTIASKITSEEVRKSYEWLYI